LLSVSGNSNPSLPRPPVETSQTVLKKRGQRIPLRRPPNPAYDKPMAKAEKFELESPAPILDEDEETLTAIDEGIRDAKAGRTVPAEEVRRRLPKWITASSTRKER
jgi:hypothetical protein